MQYMLLDYPFTFCGHRWVENEDCAARAETLLVFIRISVAWKK